MAKKIKIALSSCLLGNAVRYDGLDKRNDKLIEDLGDEFELVAVCPEIMAGLGVPRPAVQLVNSGDEIQAIGVNNKTLNVSSDIVRAAKEFVQVSHDICGLVLKSRSPSCGLGSTQIFDQENKIIDYDSGLFACYVSQVKSDLPIVEDTLLGKPVELKAFCQQVRVYSNQAG